MSKNHLPDLFSRIAAAQNERASQPLPGIAEQSMDRAWATSSPRRRARRGIAILLPLSLAATVAIILNFRPAQPILQANIGDDPVAVQSGAALTASADIHLPLRFSDGSSVTFLPGSRAHVTRLLQKGAELVLENGELEAKIIPLPGAKWQIQAGPYRVLVTGTRFLAAYRPELQILSVRLYEGSVFIQGPMLGQGVPLAAGQLLEIGVGQALAIRSLDSTLPKRSLPEISPTLTVAASSPTKKPHPDSPSTTVILPAEEREKNHDRLEWTKTPEWVSLAEEGKYAESLSAAEREGYAELCQRLQARRLLTLGDVARFASNSVRAREAFEALVRRFPRNRYTADAVFGLGRLASETNDLSVAVQWFERYIRSWPQDSLAEQAAGRLLELYQALGNDEHAKQHAADYLERYPNGMRASLAKRILSASEPGTAH